MGATAEAAVEAAPSWGKAEMEAMAAAEAYIVPVYR